MLWQPRMKALSGEGVWLMGWIWALINVANVAGSALISRLVGRFSREHLLCAMTAWRGLSLAAAAVSIGFTPALLGLLGTEVGFAVSEPLVQAWLNERISSEQRATVLSVRAMFFTLGGGAGLACMGWVARSAGIPTAWLASALVFAVTAPGFLILGRLVRESRTTAAAEVQPLPAPPLG